MLQEEGQHPRLARMHCVVAGGETGVRPHVNHPGHRDTPGRRTDSDTVSPAERPWGCCAGSAVTASGCCRSVWLHPGPCKRQAMIELFNAVLNAFGIGFDARRRQLSTLRPAHTRLKTSTDVETDVRRVGRRDHSQPFVGRPSAGAGVSQEDTGC